MTYVDLRPDNTRLVRVLVNGRWWDDELEALVERTASCVTA
jgi:hypothetical protein